MDSQKVKAILFVFFLLLSLVLLLLGILVETTLLIFSGVAFFIAIIFALYLNKASSPLQKLLQYHKLRESLLGQKYEIQKQYLKRQLSEKQFKMQTNALDKKIFYVDYKIQFADYELPKEKDLQRKREFLQKKYFKGEIPEDLYNEMQLELSKELAQLNSQNKNK